MTERDMETFGETIAVMKEQLKNINEKLGQLLDGKSLGCVKHDNMLEAHAIRLQTMEDAQQKLKDNQEWYHKLIISGIVLGLISLGFQALPWVIHAIVNAEKAVTK